MTDDAILVLGGTGKTGRPLVRTLREAGRLVRAASRNGETRFDWSDQSTWAPALDGAAAVYLMAPADPAVVPVFVQQATEAGVRRFVVLSGRGIEQVPATVFRGMAAAERAVRASGAEWSIIRPNNFNQNFDDDAVWRTQLRAGRLALPTGSVPDPFVDVHDIADVAAALLTTDGHHGEVYELSGPRPVTFEAAVATMARAAGRPIEFVELTPAEYRGELRAEGLPEEAVDELDALFEAMRAGHHTEPRDGVQRVLGREPLDFDVYAARAAAAGAWS
ncbi:NAD(P)H-binding protein [Streptomyces jumonjinensis]|uniref:SDR family NAD(P)-dependent oxidoreductase n=1 Tax=Streptomyces jumonjinensis TaxID=1945 RepID=A0A646KJ71_STRJU|nr:NAD(P)H-binding protein [Streptomyces jumonjinensis]MQT02118.1 SDR family NAD(P)-dependent oxidoreductase [Streptomyces jumonjinensis]